MFYKKGYCLNSVRDSFIKLKKKSYQKSDSFKRNVLFLSFN